MDPVRQVYVTGIPKVFSKMFPSQTLFYMATEKIIVSS